MGRLRPLVAPGLLLIIGGGERLTLPAAFMRKFFAPDAVRLIVFGTLLVIAGLGSMQAAGFSDRSAAPFPSIPIWTAWIFLIVPLSPLATQPAPLFWGAQLVYFYLLACVVGAIVRKVRDRRSGRAGSPPPASQSGATGPSSPESV
jgi:hypothetical protein